MPATTPTESVMGPCLAHLAAGKQAALCSGLPFTLPRVDFLLVRQLPSILLVPTFTIMRFSLAATVAALVAAATAQTTGLSVTAPSSNVWWGELIHGIRIP